MKFSHWLFRFPGFRNYDAICLGRAILFRQAKAEVSEHLIEHELVHQRQMDRHGVLGFYVRYFALYFAGLIRHRSHAEAYRKNPLEVEAYAKTSPSERTHA